MSSCLTSPTPGLVSCIHSASGASTRIVSTTSRSGWTAGPGRGPGSSVRAASRTYFRYSSTRRSGSTTPCRFIKARMVSSRGLEASRRTPGLRCTASSNSSSLALRLLGGHRRIAPRRPLQGRRPLVDKRARCPRRQSRPACTRPVPRTTAAPGDSRQCGWSAQTCSLRAGES